jgi:hypothetical protein
LACRAECRANPNAIIGRKIMTVDDAHGIALVEYIDAMMLFNDG